MLRHSFASNCDAKGVDQSLRRSEIVISIRSQGMSNMPSAGFLIESTGYGSCLTMTVSGGHTCEKLSVFEFKMLRRCLATQGSIVHWLTRVMYDGQIMTIEIRTS